MPKNESPSQAIRLNEEHVAENMTRTREEHATELAEDYVEAIADLIDEHREARVTDLARLFAVTPATVNNTIARLQKAGLVTSEKYRSIFLTNSGRELAEQCKARHETVYRFLLSLGLSHKIASRDTEGIEHHCSPETLRAFKKLADEAGSS
ncbi:MAG: transcriptional regulator MntR [Verrucomicrobiales bacterium]|nr:transcriptional regulator MntR [Verrucomicrobiales bacterium]|tara:strand:+ start:531 stop:986 length:456 start_codon:yes stop_codon:yes gene_type:complete